MDAESEVQKYVIAILKSAVGIVSSEIKQQIVKIDPSITIRQLIAKIKQQLGLSPNDSLFLYAYGSILHSEDTIADINRKFAHKTQGTDGRLEIFYSEMAAFGNGQ